MLRHRSAVGKQTVTHQLWRTKSGDSNNLPLLFDATRLLVAPRCASKKHDPPYLFYNPLKQPNIGCNRGSKIEKRDLNTSVELLPAASRVYLSMHLSINLSICLSINFYLSIDLTISLSICLSVYLSIKFSLSLSLSKYIYLCLSVYLSIYLAMSLPIYFSICLGI